MFRFGDCARPQSVQCGVCVFGLSVRNVFGALRSGIDATLEGVNVSLYDKVQEMDYSKTNVSFEETLAFLVLELRCSMTEGWS